MEVLTQGRTDIEDYFRLSGMRENKKNPHHPFLVFDTRNRKIQVKIIENPVELLSFSDGTKVMAQWSGRWRSDFFQFTIGQLKKFISENPAQSYNLI